MSRHQDMRWRRAACKLVDVRILIFIAFLLIAGAPGQAGAQNFVLPLECRIGEICMVQNYFDLDPGPGARDPLCGPLTYNGHDGLDIRVPGALARAGTRVLAPAAGVVRGVRDGEADGAYLRDGAIAVAGRDCGNGVRIEHENGLTSQLCHLRQGSVRVRLGEHVMAGQPIGLVGLSGFTQFPHLHLALTRNGAPRDPLTGLAPGALACGGAAAAPGPHWSAAARAALVYRGARWFEAGFTGTAPAAGANPEDLPANTARTAPALVYWALAIGPHGGDVLRLRLFGPDETLVSEATRTQPRDQAQAWVFTGKRTPQSGWPAGTYRGEAQVLRGGQIIATRVETLSLAR